MCSATAHPPIESAAIRQAGAISARGLTKTFGEGRLTVHAVREIDLDVAPGEVLLVMGPSGSGKTTLLLMLGAMLRPTRGSITVDGINLATAPERRLPALRALHLGFIFQDFNLLSALTALENIELACNLAGTTGRRARSRATELLSRVGLDDRLRHRPDQLSGGEKQRVAIARALANNPSVMLADEPTANLDSGHGSEMTLRMSEPDVSPMWDDEQLRLSLEDPQFVAELERHFCRMQALADR